ncbi:MAG: FecR family protein [Prolixibacteraceae bacterium]|jgi:ferric-dicitrate binding protein FerR (iron transport regulator)|nr:FecR family protein [Prolixibacteraceae bacterium]
MSPENDEIYDLIAKSFTDQLTEEESVHLNSWKTAEKANIDTYNDFVEIWKHSNRLALPSQIDLPQSLKTTRQKAGIYKTEIKWMSLIRQIAAVLILTVISSYFYNLLLKPGVNRETEAVVYQEVRAAYGTQTRVELPDGTMVNLNSGSTLKFPTSFKNYETRLVYLSGEGNFKVTKNSEQPFVVDINKLQVKVLGTTFNVDAYPGNSVTTIALVEGKILLQNTVNDKISDLMEMKPNQVAFFNQSENKLQWKNENDLTKYIAWTDGKIVFSNDPINTVIHKLENWYNVDIELSDKKLENYRFTGTFIDEPLEQVLSILNLTSQMQYKVIPAKKLGDNSFSKRKIIIKSKMTLN